MSDARNVQTMAKAGHDYDGAKALLLKGMSLKDISDKLTIPYDALQRYALRHKWTIDKTRIRQVVSDHVGERLQQECVNWVMGIATKTTATLAALGNYDFAGRVNELDPESYVRSLDTLDRIARRNYGLDGDGNARPRVTLNVALVNGDKVTGKLYPNLDAIDVTSQPVNE